MIVVSVQIFAYFAMLHPYLSNAIWWRAVELAPDLTVSFWDRLIAGKLPRNPTVSAVDIFPNHVLCAVSPDTCLLGCVFLILEYDRTYPSQLQEWRTVISENGGEEEMAYSPRVTHVLCETQRNILVQQVGSADATTGNVHRVGCPNSFCSQALRDGKRCVTAYWLSDVVVKQHVLPPWQAIHLPLPFR